MLTALFSGLAFSGLIITIFMQHKELGLQREELSLTREELKGHRGEMQAQNKNLIIQRFENTFFNILELLESCRDDITTLGMDMSQKHGRDAISSIYGYFHSSTTKYINTESGQKPMLTDECKSVEGIVQKYYELYRKYEHDLGQYYRVLYNALKFVDYADSTIDKKLYTNLIRAQLSSSELKLLFYNCLSHYGKEKMAPLIKNYHILKHLDKKTLPKHIQVVLAEFNNV